VKRWIQAIRAANLGVPKLCQLRESHQPSIHHANETVVTLDRRLIPVPPKDQDCRIAGYRLWRRASSQCYLGILFHEVLLNWRHARVLSCDALRPQLSDTQTQQGLK
jgi:hypothetical protein